MTCRACRPSPTPRSPPGAPPPPTRRARGSRCRARRRAATLALIPALMAGWLQFRAQPLQLLRSRCLALGAATAALRRRQRRQGLRKRRALRRQRGRRQRRRLHLRVAALAPVAVGALQHPGRHVPVRLPCLKELLPCILHLKMCSSSNPAGLTLLRVLSQLVLYASRAVTHALTHCS